MQGDYALAEWLPSPNFWAGGDGNQLIVVHATASNGPQTGYQLATSQEFTDGQTASTHYINDVDGKVYQIVRENDSAWGNCCATGNSPYDHGYNWNKNSISIENVKHSNDNAEPLTSVQYQSLLALIRDIGKRQNIPLQPGTPTGKGIIFHHDLDPVNRARCPGTFPYTTFIKDLQGGHVAQHWYEFPWGVRFGKGDPGFGGAHDATILTPPNYEVTFPLSGTVVDLSSPSWGKQVGIQLDTPYHGIPYFAFLHLSALHPGLALNKHVNKGDIAGWTGGATDASQYAGTSNPTGHNFLNDPVMSSQVQVGFALMRGPVYGEGAGWSPVPDASLNPEQIITDLRNSVIHTPAPQERKTWLSTGQQVQAEDTWNIGVAFVSKVWGVDLAANTGIFHAWQQEYMNGRNRGFPITEEEPQVNWDNKPIVVQYFSSGARCEWDGAPHWY